VTTEMQIYLLVRRRGPMTAHDVAGELGLTDMQATKALRCLHDDGALERAPADRKYTLGRTPFRYWVDPAKRLCDEGCACTLCCA
jgi:predicted ArsR family transcriptional regulator